MAQEPPTYPDYGITSDFDHFDWTANPDQPLPAPSSANDDSNSNSDLNFINATNQNAFNIFDEFISFDKSTDEFGIHYRLSYDPSDNENWSVQWDVSSDGSDSTDLLVSHNGIPLFLVDSIDSSIDESDLNII